MDELYVVFVESIDMDLKVYEKKDEAQADFEERQKAGKPVKLETFGMWQVVEVERSNGNSANDPDYWERMILNNGTCKLVLNYTWHQPPEKEGYYADYTIRF